MVEASSEGVGADVCAWFAQRLGAREIAHDPFIGVKIPEAKSLSHGSWEEAPLRSQTIHQSSCFSPYQNCCTHPLLSLVWSNREVIFIDMKRTNLLIMRAQLSPNALYRWYTHCTGPSKTMQALELFKGGVHLTQNLGCGPWCGSQERRLERLS